MLIFFYGEDTYRMRLKMREFLEEQRDKSPTGLRISSFGSGADEGLKPDFSFSDFKQELSANSLFGETRIIILNNVFSLPEFKKKILENAEDLVKRPEIILINQENGDPGQKELSHLSEKKVKTQEFKKPRGIKLQKWLKKEFDEYKAPISDEALTLLIESVGEDSWLLENTVKKLVSYKNHQEITLEDVKMHVKQNAETDIFETIEAIAQKNKKQALKLVHQHLDKGESPFYLFSMLAFQFRNLLSVRDLIDKGKSLPEIFHELKLHPLVVKKSFFQARFFNIQELKRIYQKLFQFDFQMKIGRIKPEIALELFISQL